MYKSSDESLRRRGKFDENDYEKYVGESFFTLVSMINDDEAVKRSVAINILSDDIITDESLIKLVLDRLVIENSLYVRLEICKTLEKAGRNAADIMIGYLAKVGDNRYNKVPKEVSKKKSFPLPRDLVARTLGNMHQEVFPSLINAIDKVDENRLSELIDAIGFMVYKNKELSTKENLQIIIAILENKSDNELILWKCALSLMSFPFEESVGVLNKMMDNKNLANQAKRSILLIKEKI